jgi:hypothetical protein
MTENFLYKIDFPFTKNIIKFKELNTKNQLDIEKINLYYPQSIDFYHDYHESFIDIIKNCVQNFEDFSKIDIIEYILFCLKLRVISIGNVLSFSVKSKDEGVKETKIKIDLNDVINNLLTMSLNSLNDTDIKLENPNIFVKIGWPSLKSIKFFHNLVFTETDISQKVIESIPEYIKYMYIDDRYIDFDSFTHEQKETAYNSFPASLKNKIENIVLQNISDLNNSSIINIKYFEDQKFNFYDLFYIEFIKLMFSQNPKRIYEEIYVLSSYSIDSNYIMNLSQNERKLFLSFVEIQRKGQEGGNQQVNNAIDMEENGLNNRSLEDLAVEFGDIPPNY